MTFYRYTHGEPLRRPDETIAQGDLCEPTPDELRAFSGRFEPVDDPVCTTVKDDGEVCGRDLPCPYHDRDTDDETDSDDTEE